MGIRYYIFTKTDTGFIIKTTGTYVRIDRVPGPGEDPVFLGGPGPGPGV